MGAVTLQNEKGHQYTAKIIRPQGIDQVYTLPTIKPDGLALSIQEQTDSSLLAKVFSSSAAQAYLVGHAHSKIYEANKLQLREGWNEVIISTKLMPAGIAVFTLFNADGTETCERLVFMN